MLTLRDLHKRFGDVTAVDGLSLDVKKGEIFGLLGPNGAGKSTTIGMAVGLVPPDSGTVELDGAGSPTNAVARKSIGVAPQSLSLYEELTARENLDFFGRMYGLGGSSLTARRDELLALAGLSDRAGSRVGTFSGGMKRRLNIAAALMHDPPLLLLDEPTAGVDPQSRNAIFEQIETLRAAGRTIVYTTHYMEEAERLCDRVGIIDHGKLLALDTVDALIDAHGGASVITLDTTDETKRFESRDPASDVRTVLADGPVRSIRIDRPSLESVFLSLTGRSLRD